MRRHALPVVLVLGSVLAVALSARAQDGAVEIPIPEGVLPLDIPEGNPLTAAKVELGRKLYFDPRLSADDTVACATCHDPRHAFAEPRPVSIGVGAAEGVRNAPTVLNAAFLREQFWDGRADTLEAQALQPLINPAEMAMPDHPAVEAKIGELDEYAPLFEAAYGTDAVTIERVVQAVASFERTLVSLAAPIDRFLAGETGAISESAKRGWELFNGEARCNNCHGHIGVLPLFTDEEYHNIGVAAKHVNFEELARRVEESPGDLPALSHEEGVNQLGRFLVTRERKDIGAFKTPQLRNVALTAPYMHDGSEATLHAVMELYDRGGEPNPWLDGGIVPLDLSEQQKQDLVELMGTFTSDDLERFERLAELMP